MKQQKRKGNSPIDKTYKYLNRVKIVDDMINAKQLQIDDLRSRATSTALHTDSERVQSSGAKDKVGDLITKVADLCNELNNDIDDFVDMKADVMHKIDMLEDLSERRCLYLRYFQYLDWDDIVKKLQSCDSVVYRTHRSAMKHLSEILFPKDDNLEK